MKNNVRSCIDQLFQDADRIDGIRIEVDVDDSADSGLFGNPVVVKPVLAGQYNVCYIY